MLQRIPHHQSHLTPTVQAGVYQGHSWDVIHPTPPIPSNLLSQSQVPQSFTPFEPENPHHSNVEGKKKVEWGDLSPWNERSLSIEHRIDKRKESNPPLHSTPHSKLALSSSMPLTVPVPEVFTLPLLFQVDSVGLRVSRIHIFLLFHHSIFPMIFQSWSEHFWADLAVQRTFPMDCQWTDNKPATEMTRTDGILMDIANGSLTKVR